MRADSSCESSRLFLQLAQRTSSTVSSCLLAAACFYSLSIVPCFASISLVFSMLYCVALSVSFCNFSFSFWSLSQLTFQKSTSCLILTSICSSLARQELYSRNICSIFCISASFSFNFYWRSYTIEGSAAEGEGLVNLDHRMRDLARTRCRFLRMIWLNEFREMKPRENFDILSTMVAAEWSLEE